jgi:hypothetical protein
MKCGLGHSLALSRSCRRLFTFGLSGEGNQPGERGPVSGGRRDSKLLLDEIVRESVNPFCLRRLTMNTSRLFISMASKASLAETNGNRGLVLVFSARNATYSLIPGSAWKSLKGAALTMFKVTNGAEQDAGLTAE